MQDSVFTKIIKGEIPCHKIYEDDRTIAFLDIHPIREGHILVVPKIQVDHFDDLPDPDYQAVFATVKKIAKQLKAVTGQKRAVVMVMGYDVPHAHVHLVPADHAAEIYEAFSHITEIATNDPDHSALAVIATKLKIESRS